MFGQVVPRKREAEYKVPRTRHLLLSCLRWSDRLPRESSLVLQRAQEHTLRRGPPAFECTIWFLLASRKPTKDAVQTAEVPAVEQAQETTLKDAKTDSEARDGVLTDSASENESEYDILTKPVAVEAEEEQQAKREAVEAPSADVEMKESENKNARQQDSDTQTKEEDAEKTQLEDEQKAREAE
ncbi:hypothetical protein FOTG_16657 [Fusarium oxysporum f. sp. vasinfectum 25433]|uniref:Uncharacterized protein n=1 Tax=Fusarium oxysporum f. sp. vasinfectum 25433 TaxID=1089449 RepID=X0M2R4_FUSOX|nr:hypothetical protein FOTG_16657 [Fusarium oxysporum f. sp. vasinfectum 25433]